MKCKFVAILQNIISIDHFFNFVSNPLEERKLNITIGIPLALIFQHKEQKE